MTEASPDPHFFQLVLSLQTAAMHHMGKIASPITGQVERNLEMARYSIDMLDMLKRKMSGNLSKEEETFLGHVLYELRLNYVDEANKGETAAAAAAPEPTAASSEVAKESDSTESKSADPASP
ncbi:MAG TPA: DUF1844 domain-containing protein [Candidatus Deferrimicrobium sp.]|nr:DUF1844 domain-containing protein [Candidatus Deferrimicrobium sp.]